MERCIEIIETRKNLLEGLIKKGAVEIEYFTEQGYSQNQIEVLRGILHSYMQRKAELECILKEIKGE